MSIKQRTERQVSKALRLERAARGVEELRHAAFAAEQEFALELEAVAPPMRESAYNLVHYLAVRRHDVRQLQDDLARLGLSSLGRMEAHVMASLQAVLEALHALRKRPGPEISEDLPVTYDTGDALLAEHANAILGPAPEGRDTRIMVTMPGEAADDPELIRSLVEDGMGIVRINCAHDTPEVWERLVEQLHKAERDSGRRCLVSFDLAGPKLRTGPMAHGPAVVKWRPVRDALGRVTQPALVRFVTRTYESDAGEATIPVTGGVVDKAKRGDTIDLLDTRKRKRMLKVLEVQPGVCLSETETTAYVVPGTQLMLKRRGRAIARGKVGKLPSAEEWITLHDGDVLDIVHGDEPGRDAIHDDDGKEVREPPIVSCPLAEVFTSVRVGEPILFDDGKIRGKIRAAVADRLRVEITAVAGGAAKLKAEKGINLPESQLALPALTVEDVEDLATVTKHADMVALSFVQRSEDIEALIAEMTKLDAPQLGIVLKIETQAAFNRLPMLLLTAMRHPPVAVMVARGDLGVEVGFERLSEVQEEILWLCEAAHVPVIWATQVLESLAKGGMPSRAEVTDAAMGSRAECVMLNKGPYIRETLRFLIDVLERMSEHQYKKTARLRKLRVSDVNGSKLEDTARGKSGPEGGNRDRARGRAARAESGKKPARRL
jgi:pyruvate kinase